tara:strand:- start:39 stop:665 length:627 start_codon:yes stop_codon:yes gene_type:complete
MKQLVINADDFFLSSIFNEVILECISKGIVSATSAMVDRYNDTHAEQIKSLKESGAAIGLHIEFASNEDFDAQILQQYERFKELFEQEPSHIDMHKHEYRDEGYPCIMEFAALRDIPYRHSLENAGPGKTTTRQSFSGISNSSDKIAIWIQDFEDGESGELVMHPGSFDPNCKTSLNYEREVEVTKCRLAARVANELGIEITNLSQLA